MRLNRSTIAALVRELEEHRAVVQSVPETGSAPRAGAGRPSIDVNPASDAVFVLAAEVGVDSLELARVGLGGVVLDRTSRPTPEHHDPERIADLLAEMMRGMLRHACPGSRLVGVGLAIPGVVTNSAGLVRFAPNLGWTDVPLGSLVTGRIGMQVPVHIGNDAELGALAEHIRGVGRHKDNVIYLSCDVGVGGGVIVGGQPLMGASGYAGEVGHLRFNPRGRTCRCGNVGCWETEIGSHAVAEAVGCPATEIHRLAEYLQPGTKPPAALRELGRALGLGLGGLVNVFNPEIVILGGVLRWVFPLVSDDVLDALEAWALSAPAEQAQIVLPWLGGDSVILGASELAFSDLLHDPVEVLAGVSGAVEAIRGA
jgi:predicted NBD/HSP70 family sugar kinase